MEKTDKILKNKGKTSKTYIPVLMLVIACVAVYFPILSNDFLYRWDDQWMAINRYTEGGLNFDNLWAILTEFYHGQYAPINEYMYLILYNLFGYNAFVFHLASLVLHAANVCLVFACLRKMLAAGVRIKTANVNTVAFLTALIFAVHPMNVESVAWISAVKILDYTIFYLAATYTFLLFLEKKKPVYYAVTLMLFVLSFGCKEQAVTFPLWLLTIYWLYGHSFRIRKLWLQVAPFFVLAIAFGFVTMYSQAASGGGILSKALSYPLWQRFVLGSYSLFEYASKLLFPYKLLYVYPFPIVIGEPLPAWMLLYPALLVVITVTLWKYLTKPPVAFGLWIFIIHIIITLHIIPLSRFAIVADRYVYLSSVGFSFIISYYFVWILCEKKGMIRKFVIVFLSAYTLWLGVSTNLRSREWKDSDSIKKELRELLKQRDDYLPEEHDEKKDLSMIRKREGLTLKHQYRTPFPAGDRGEKI